MYVYIFLVKDDRDRDHQSNIVTGRALGFG